MSRTHPRLTAAFTPTLPLAPATSLACRGLNAICTRLPSPRPTQHPRRRRAAPTPTMGLFGLGVPEIIVIAGVGILVFGPSKIAELGKDLGGIAGGVKKASAEFKDAMQESLEEADREIEERKLQKEEASSKTVDTTASSVESTTAVAKESAATSVETATSVDATTEKKEA